MEWIYKISILTYVISMILELKFLAVPSEESHVALLKSKMDSWTLLKMVLGILGTIAFLGIMLFPFLQSSFEFNPYLLAFGLLLILIGRILTLKGSLDIRKHFAQNEGVLLNEGIFKYTRNPILLGLNISLLGFLTALGIYLLVPVAFLFYVGMHIKVLDEEKFLSQKFGFPYAEYKNNTKRYL